MKNYNVGCSSLAESEMFGERQSGDGEEQPDEGTEVDDDEDRKNPAYVPKTGECSLFDVIDSNPWLICLDVGIVGAFYQHDARNDDEDEQDKAKK